MHYNRVNSFQKLLTGFFVFLFLTIPLTYVFKPKPVEAARPPVPLPVMVLPSPGTNPDILSAVFNGITSAKTSSLWWKEFVLDPLLWMIVKMVMRAITQSIIAWINSGFKGTPMFLQDPGKFFLDIADQVAGEMIYNSPLGFLCRPINLRISLEFFYRSMRNYQTGARCTLTGVINNVQQFINGNFMSGGWPGFLSMSLNPSNTTFGALFVAEIELTRRIAGSQQEQREMLRWSGGWFSKQVCTGTPPKCTIVTPGRQIADAVSFQLGSPQRTQEFADELAESIDAIIGALMQQALISLQGLFGMSQPGQSGWGSYFDSTASTTSATSTSGVGTTTATYCSALSYLEQLTDPRCNGTTTGDTSGDTIIAALSEGIEAERDYQAVQQRIVSAANEVITSVNAAGTQYGNNAAIASQAATIRDRALTNIADSQRVVTTVTNLQNDYYAATTPEDQASILTQLTAVSQPGQLHDDGSVLQANQDADTVVAGLTTLAAGITQAPVDAGTGGAGTDNTGGNAAFNTGTGSLPFVGAIFREFRDPN